MKRYPATRERRTALAGLRELCARFERLEIFTEPSFELRPPSNEWSVPYQVLTLLPSGLRCLREDDARQVVLPLDSVPTDTLLDVLAEARGNAQLLDELASWATPAPRL